MITHAGKCGWPSGLAGWSSPSQPRPQRETQGLFLQASSMLPDVPRVSDSHGVDLGLSLPCMVASSVVLNRRCQRRTERVVVCPLYTRFMNGSSVADCVYHLTCRFVSVVDGRTRSHFALVSRSARMIELESGRTCGWFPAQNGTPRDVSLVLRRSLVLAAVLVASSVSMVALAPSRRDAVRRR
jgi:hypothetical protein